MRFLFFAFALFLTINESLAQTFKIPVQKEKTTASDSGNEKTLSFVLPQAKNPSPVKKETVQKKTQETIAPERKKTPPVNDVSLITRSAEEWLIVQGKELLNVLSENNYLVRRDNLLSMASSVFKEEELARMVIGRFWNELNEEQKNRYLSLFFPYFVASYASSRIPIDNVSFRIDSSRQSKKDIIINAKIDLGKDMGDLANEFLNDNSSHSVDENSSEINVFFAVRPFENRFYIRDVHILGRSMIKFLRQKIELLYSTKGVAFLDEMHDTIEMQNQKTAHLNQSQNQNS